MYVCMYVCMCLCMYVCMYACIMCVCVCVCMYACMYVCVYYVCMYVCMYVCVCVYVCMDGCMSSGSDHTSVTMPIATVATAARILPVSFGRVWATAQTDSVSCAPPDEIKWCEVRRTGWASDGVTSSHQFM